MEVFGYLKMLNVIFHGDLTAPGEVILQNATVQSSLTFNGTATSTISNSVISCTISGYDSAHILIDHSRLSSLASYMHALINVSDSVAVDLYLSGNSSIVFTNLSMNSIDTYGKINVQFNAVPHSASAWNLWENSTVSVTNSEIGQAVNLHDFATLTVTNSSLSVQAHDYSKLNVTYCKNCPIQLYHYAQCTITNFTSNKDFFLYEHSQATLINSTLSILVMYPTFNSGNWTIDHQIPSGTGNAELQTLTLVNTVINTFYEDLSVVGSTTLFINNSQYWEVLVYDSSDVTLHNSTVSYVVFENFNTKGYITSSTLTTLLLQTNQTVYLADVTITSFFEKDYYFYEGDVTGYNDTFTGAESWASPKGTLGPNVYYNELRFSYFAYSHVNLTITHTPNIYYVYSFDNANVTLCYSAGSAICRGYSNTTMSNSTINVLNLFENSFGAIINSSHVLYLNHYDSSNYYVSPDSKIGF